VFVGRTLAEAQARAHAHHGREVPLAQDEDVLDTWFSSALWPFSTLGWPERTRELERYYPTSALVTGFDIIFFWVARMIMMGLRFAGDVPFRDVYITGLIRDEHGQKMSKSKGNILDPLDLVDGIDVEKLVAKRTSGLMQPQMRASIEKATRKQFPQGIPSYGTDALRFTFAALATPGRDIRFDLARVEGYRNFCNKLWNATRYVAMSTEGKDCGATGRCEYSVADRWIRSRLRHTIGEFRHALAAYRFDLAATALYEFTWHEFCDWYLELSKPVLQSDKSSAELQRGTRQTLVVVLEALLRLVHPIMPFISEEIWLRIAPLAGRNGPTIMLEPFPVAEDFPADAGAEADIDWLRRFILALRQIRGENDIAPSKRFQRIFVNHARPADSVRLSTYKQFIDRLANVDEVAPWDPSVDSQVTANALVGELEVYVPLKGLKDDLDAERARLAKLQERAQKDLAKAEAKLANEEFMRNAPAEVSARERQRAQDLTRELAQLATQLERLERLR
jgi:valyl-tRNA synthetase